MLITNIEIRFIMKIDSAQIFLDSSHSSMRQHEVRESLVTGISKPGSRWSEDNLESGFTFTRSSASLHISNSKQDYLSLLGWHANHASGAGDGPQATSAQAKIGTSRIADKTDPETVTSHDARLQTLIMLIEKITGKKLKFIDASDLKQSAEKTENHKHKTEQPKSDDAAATSAPQWGLEYHYQERIHEIEHTEFSASGIVKTKDGKEIHLDLELNMSRQFIQQTNIDIVAGAARLKDPLVINFDGNAAELTDEKYSFDIDVDGIEDQISHVQSGSGFLALDRNNDGEINDGKELFGAISGDGFTELAEYDADGNGFIDEADDIYNKLRIWTRDVEGNSQLLALGDMNVGAIYLGNIDTPFEINDTENNTQGVIRQTSIYLGDDGSIGTVQQIDLFV